MSTAPEAPPRVILYDAHCNLCHAALRFILRRDSRERFHFAPLQSPAATRLLGAPPEGNSLILIEQGTVYQESSAALRIARQLCPPWPAAFYIGILVPPPLRNALYRWIARNRYRCWGRKESCDLSAPDLPRDRLLG